MRCQACNVALSDAESTRKSATTGEYLDLCNHCLSAIDGDDLSVVEGNEQGDSDDDYEDGADSVEEES